MNMDLSIHCDGKSSHSSILMFFWPKMCYLECNYTYVQQNFTTFFPTWNNQSCWSYTQNFDHYTSI
jgi:hypothetical protein